MDKKEIPYCPFCGRELETLSKEYHSMGCKHCDFSIDPDSPYALEILFYCPACGKEEVLSSRWDPLTTHTTYMSCGCGQMIKHYRCMCGNCLAGSITIQDLSENNIELKKFFIKDNNEGGGMYECKQNNLKRLSKYSSPKERAEQQYIINEKYRERRKLRVQQIREELNESN